jgi:hypothetical protein
MISTRVATGTIIVAAISTMKSKRLLVDLLHVSVQRIVHDIIIGFFVQNRVSKASIAKFVDVLRTNLLHFICTR